MTRKNVLFASIIVILAVVAAIGWARARSTQNLTTPLANPTNADTAATYGYSATATPAYSQEGPEPYENVIQPPVVVRAPETAPLYGPAAAYAPPPYAPAPAYPPEPRYRYEDHHHHRSKKKEVEIVAGSAAAGAAIGAVAGGGKGAGIGALAGGAGGFLYDRLSHH